MLKKYGRNILNNMRAHRNVAIMIFAVIKHILQKSNWSDNRIAFILAMLLVPLTFLIILFFRFYRFVIYLILKCKLGSKLYRLLTGDEVLFNILDTDGAKSVITVLLEVEFKGNGDEVFKIVGDEVFRVFLGGKFGKLHCTREEYLGYYYFKKCKVTKQEYIKEFESEDLKSSLGTITAAALPKNDKGMWDVHISKKISKNCYPIVFRFHHTVGDADAVFNMFSKEFSGKSANIRLQLDNIYPVLSINDEIKILKPECFERNDLIGTLMGKKHMVWFTEKEPKYLSVIKQIKKKYKVTFTDILLTALTSSLNAYCKKKNYCTPHKIFISVLLLQNRRIFSCNQLYDYDLSNKFSIAWVDAALEQEQVQENLVERLQIMAKEYDRLKNKSIDFIFDYWQMRVLFKFIPIVFLKIYTFAYDISVLLSNIPGCGTMNIFNGSKVKEFVIFAPNNIRSGITLMVTTYENRLNLAFTLDKSIVPNYEDGEEICKNTLKCFDTLYEKCY